MLTLTHSPLLSLLRLTISPNLRLWKYGSMSGARRKRVSIYLVDTFILWKTSIGWHRKWSSKRLKMIRFLVWRRWTSMFLTISNKSKDWKDANFAYNYTELRKPIFRFEEMCPIFKNTTINEADIGEYMQNFLRETGQKFEARRNLIGSMFGIKMLFITPLLKWYLEHGLVITKVYQVIQFNPVKCFAKFADNISDDRRAGMCNC